MYDKGPIRTELGFVEINDDTHSGTIYVDATDYTKWTYINLAEQTVEIRDINEVEPAEWDFALHRYDVKTNNGTVVETSASSIGEIMGGDFYAMGEYVPDMLSEVAIDMSGMVFGNIEYAESYLNPVLCQWLDVNIERMPPIYTLSNKVYLLQLSNGQQAVLLFTNYMNAAGKKGYITIRYLYPMSN